MEIKAYLEERNWKKSTLSCVVCRASKPRGLLGPTSLEKNTKSLGFKTCHLAWNYPLTYHSAPFPLSPPSLFSA